MGKPDDSDASVASLAGQVGGTCCARASAHLSPNRGPLARVRATAQHSDDDSENDAEVSSDARAPSPNARTCPMSYPLAKPHCDRLAGKVRPAIKSEANASLARSLCECALFVCGVVVPAWLLLFFVLPAVCQCRFGFFLWLLVFHFFSSTSPSSRTS